MSKASGSKGVRACWVSSGYQLETRKNLWRLGGRDDSVVGNDHGEPWWIRSRCLV